VPPPEGGAEVEATESVLKELLGTGQNKVVFLNAKLVNGALRDPWGKPYKLRFKSQTQSDIEDTFSTAISFPNRNRLKQQ
jgi:hypothetical protein